MKAIKKPIHVEVWQITKYDSDKTDAYPEWVNELFAWESLASTRMTILGTCFRLS